jgi:long-subunit fatty acid transport protein
MASHPRFFFFSLAVGSVLVASSGSGFAESTPASVLDVHVNVSNTCRTRVTPPSYGVSAGSTFTVNWINEASSEYPVDIDKIDRFNSQTQPVWRRFPQPAPIGPPMAHDATPRNDAHISGSLPLVQAR